MSVLCFCATVTQGEFGGTTRSQGSGVRPDVFSLVKRLEMQLQMGDLPCKELHTARI